MPDEESLSDLDRRSLRILARSSKSGTPGDRLSARLERAAETGSRIDYEKAEQTFDSLPAEERIKIGSKAEKQAETERTLVAQRRRRASPPPPPPPSGDDALEWKPIFAAASETNPAPPPKKPRTKAAAAEEAEPAGMSWQLGNIPGNPKMPTTGRKAKAPAPKPIKPIPEDWSPEDDEKAWDWQRIPEDPVLNGGKGKKADGADPIEELRRQMLGLDAKYGKR